MYSRFRTAVTVSHLTELDRRSWHLNLMKNSLNTVCYHLNVESKKAKLIERENRMMINKGWGVGELESCGSKGKNIQLEDK